MNRRRYAARNMEGLRIISATNGLWQVQRRIGTTGNRERDPWIAIHRPTDLLTAKDQFAAASLMWPFPSRKPTTDKPEEPSQ